MSAQVIGLTIAYVVNAATAVGQDRPVLRLMVAVVHRHAAGLVILVAIKGYVIGDPKYHLEAVRGQLPWFAWTALSAFIIGLCVSLVFLFKFREAHAAAALHRAEAERHLMSKHAIEAELKLMQAQVEPHFLFNTLASVQYLTETDPREAGKLLSHLIDYLRAALPQLRASSTTLAQGSRARRRLPQHPQDAHGTAPRHSPSTSRPNSRSIRFRPTCSSRWSRMRSSTAWSPPPTAGRSASPRSSDGDRLAVSVTDTGRGTAAPPAGQPGNGVGLSNVRERLAALYGPRGRFTLEESAPRGTRATLSIPFEP